MNPTKKVVCFPLKEKFDFNNKILKWDMVNLQFKGLLQEWSIKDNLNMPLEFTTKPLC